MRPLTQAPEKSCTRVVYSVSACVIHAPLDSKSECVLLCRWEASLIPPTARMPFGLSSWLGLETSVSLPSPITGTFFLSVLTRHCKHSKTMQGTYMWALSVISESLTSKLKFPKELPRGTSTQRPKLLQIWGKWPETTQAQKFATSITPWYGLIAIHLRPRLLMVIVHC